MNYSDFRMSYCRPTVLSDPNRDFSEDELNNIINTPDNAMGWDELSCIFQPFLPAGSYEENVYFLPVALRFIVENDEDGECLIENLILWIGIWKNHLKKESGKQETLYNKLLLFFQNLLTEAFTEFNLVTGKDGCLHPDKSETVLSIIDGFNNRDYFSDLADSWLDESLNDIENYDIAAWFLFLIDEYFGSMSINSPLVAKWSEDEMKKEKGRNIVTDKAIVDGGDIIDYWDKILLRI